MLIVALPPSGAHAATPPVITAGPAIAGAPVVGSALTASATWPADPPATAKWTWLRCNAKGDGCRTIDGAKAAAYTVGDADLGATLRVRLDLVGKDGSASKRSEPTAVVTAPPVATPTPEPPPTVTPAPAPPPPTAPAPPPVTALPVVPPPLLDPFPVVRIKGRLTSTGAHVTLLAVRAPRGARIAVACRGRDCPVRRFTAAATGLRRLHRFERVLRAGTRLQITVSRPGYVGKVTVIVIRRDAAPWRSDRCLEPGATRTVRCASA